TMRSMVEGLCPAFGPSTALRAVPLPMSFAHREEFQLVIRRAPAAPDVDAQEQEQPHHVDEMPVPGGRLEAEMLLRGEMPLVGADQADGEEDGADDDMEAVEAGRHEEGRGIDIVFEAKRRVAVLIGLDRGEQEAERDRQPEALDQPVAMAVDQGVV